MKTSVSQRVKDILQAKNISVAQFAKMINMQQVTCNRQLKDEQPVSLKLLEGLLSVFSEVSAEWILRGVDGEHVMNNGNNAEAEKWRIKYETVMECYQKLLSARQQEDNNKE